MRRTHAPIGAVTVVCALHMVTPGLAAAEPDPGPANVAQLIAELADANQKLQDVGAAVQTRQESVNKAITDVQEARDAAAAAKADVENDQRAVTDANKAIEAAQQRYNHFAAATYINGPSGSYAMARSPEDLIASASANQTLALSAKQVLLDLQRARTEMVNKESSAREAQEKAESAAADAQHSQDDAVAALVEAQHEFGGQQAEINQLVAERDAAQKRLQTVQATLTKSSATIPQAALPSGSAGSANPGTGDRWTQPGAAPAAAPYGQASQWDTTLPMVPSAFVSGDPIAIVNTVLQIAQSSAQLTADMGRNFLTKLGILKPADTGITNNGGIPRVYGSQASEYVIRRAMSQQGVPYSWGGGNAAGPSNGIDDGAGTVGFDCSGLILYAFAGVGIKLPHYSGSQYEMGRKIPAAQMRRGDVIFYGPGGSQHVALYLGNGQMLEAPTRGRPSRSRRSAPAA